MWSVLSQKQQVIFSLSVSLAILLSGLYFVTATTSAQSKTDRGFNNRTESHQPGLENYDIRTDKSRSAYDMRISFRADGNQSAVAVADTRDAFVRGENDLRLRVPTLKIEYNNDIRIPEVIAPDVKQGRAFLTNPTGTSRIETLRSFSKANSLLTGVNTDQVDQLSVLTDYTNPNGDLSFTHLEQRINDIPVFRGEIKAGFTKDNRIIRVINNLAPGLDYDSLSGNFGDPLNAVRAAADSIDYKLQSPDVTPNDKESTDLVTVFGEGGLATRAEKMYFPIEPGVARPSWRVLIWQPVNAFYVIIDAESGVVLWRKNITEDQSESATYEVYRNSNAFIDIAESPAPLTPGPIDPGLGTQGAILTRENVTLVGNEGPLSFNTNGWIDDGGNMTSGNNTIAGLDIDGTDGVEAPVAGANRVFSSAWNPPPGNPAPGDAPSVTAAGNGAVIQMFYAVNRYHDALYQVGFTEEAFNFQNDNFGRGGNGNDRVSSEGQDFSGTNNANFSTPSDGLRGRMQMYVFTPPNPDRDGTTDVDVIIHELTHGTSNRLHGNASGLTSDMGRGMGEGWGDWYAHVLTAEPTDPDNGVYSEGGYLLNSATNTSNFYHGIRSQPTAVLSFTGGPQNRPHNSLTFKDIDQAQAANNDAAFAPRFGPNFGSPHFRGEVWKATLWEVRSILVQRLGFEAGTQKVLQLVTDGMKLAPLGPSFLQERDAILAAATGSSLGNEASLDVADIWEGFRRRGMGFSATVESTSPVAVTEAFDPPNVIVDIPAFSFSDASGDNDGVAEPGEPLILSVPVKNATGNTVTGVTLNVNGGPNTSYGTLSDGQIITKQINYTVPAETPCGSISTLNFNINGSAGARTDSEILIIGQANGATTENFDGVTAPALPAGWTTSQTGQGVPFVTQSGTSDSAPNSLFTPNTGALSDNNGATIVSPEYSIVGGAEVIEFRNSYDTEAGWDGGVLEISIDGGPFTDIIEAGGIFLEGGYNGSIGVNQSPIDGRDAWTGDSGGYITTRAIIPAAASGQNVQFRFRFGEDDNTFSVGWRIDDVSVTTGSTCDLSNPNSTAKFDYDGDGKTDPSIFRPTPGEWWYLRSSDLGNAAFTFGTSTDTMVPADYTGDGKTDIAFWRESTGEWFVLQSEDSGFFSFPFGAEGDIPAPGDYDGDGKADPAVYRPSEGLWFILNSGGGTSIIPFGIDGDKPVVADYDGDGKTDIAILRPGAMEWWISRSTDGLAVYQFGSAGDMNVEGDYTGDGKDDVAFFRPASSEWFILRSEGDGFYSAPFGASGDIPVPGDYDGDGTADFAIFRPAENNWYLLGSTNGFSAVQFGAAGDIPTPTSYIR